MEYGGMVHALEEIHRLLKPTGVLIDIHPVAVPSPVEIHQAGKIDVAGKLSVAQWSTDFQQADSALSEVTQRGLFVEEQHGLFDSLTHYDSPAQMYTSIIESVDKFARDTQSVSDVGPHAEALEMRAEELMEAAGPGAELIIREATHISRLRPT
jgi:hypothetical protein